jgi:hypothetical protein
MGRLHRSSDSDAVRSPHSATTLMRKGFGTSLLQASQGHYVGAEDSACGSRQRTSPTVSDVKSVAASYAISSPSIRRDMSTTSLIQSALNVVDGDHHTPGKGRGDKPPTPPRRDGPFADGGLAFLPPDAEDFDPTGLISELATANENRRMRTSELGAASLDAQAQADDFHFSRMEFSIVDWNVNLDDCQASPDMPPQQEEDRSCPGGKMSRPSRKSGSDMTSSEERRRARSRSRARRASVGHGNGAPACDANVQKRSRSKNRDSAGATSSGVPRSSSKSRGQRSSDPQTIAIRSRSQSRERRAKRQSPSRDDKKPMRSQSRGRRSESLSRCAQPNRPESATTRRRSKSRGVQDNSALRKSPRPGKSGKEESLNDRLRRTLIEAESTLRTRNDWDGTRDASQIDHTTIIRTDGRSPRLSSRRRMSATHTEVHRPSGESTSRVSRTRGSSLSRRRLSKRNLMQNTESTHPPSGMAAELNIQRSSRHEQKESSPTIAVKIASHDASNSARLSKHLSTEESTQRLLSRRSNSYTPTTTSETQSRSRISLDKQKVSSPTFTVKSLDHMTRDSAGSSRGLLKVESSPRMLSRRTNSYSTTSSENSRQYKATTAAKELQSSSITTSSISKRVPDVCVATGEISDGSGVSKLAHPQRPREADPRLRGLLEKLRDPSFRNLTSETVHEGRQPDLRTKNGLLKARVDPDSRILEGAATIKIEKEASCRSGWGQDEEQPGVLETARHSKMAILRSRFKSVRAGLRHSSIDDDDE